MKNNFAKKMVNTGGGGSRQKEFDGPKETVEEFLARGGKITVLPPRLAPDIEKGDPPRREFDAKDMYKI